MGFRGGRRVVWVVKVVGEKSGVKCPQMVKEEEEKAVNHSKTIQLCG